MRWLLPLILLTALGCCGAAPEAVITSQQHAVEDMILCDTEVVPLLPEADRAKWSARFRAFALRALTTLAFLKDETIDLAAAHAKLFPATPVEVPE